jgi:hypothetical protein
MDERDGTQDGQMVATRTPEVVVPSARRPGDVEHSVDVGPQDAEGTEHTPDESDDWTDGDDRAWERPPARYRAGRGGFDAEAAAVAARARYAFRQRVVLALLLLAIGTGVAAGVGMPGLWWAHGAVDVLLVGYLVYLRRQVRLEEAIRARRAARMAGTRRPPAADDPELDEWAERGRAATRPEEMDEDAEVDDDASDAPAPEPVPAASSTVTAVDAEDTAAPTPKPAAAVEEERPALPRLRPTPPPPLPAGTALVEEEDDDLDLDDGAAPGYRRAAGQ